LVGVVGRSVVNDNDFVGTTALGQHAIDRTAYEGSPIEGRDHGGERPGADG
jgi:hypothetical protein